MLIDTTLREGAQLFAAYLGAEERVDIALSLLNFGIDEIEIGWVGQKGVEILAEDLAPIKNSTQISVWCPCRVEDVVKASRMKIDRINIGIPASELHREKRLQLSREELLYKLEATVSLAVNMGLSYISVGLEDISRGDLDFGYEMARVAQRAGASRVRLADSLGLSSPLEMRGVVERFKQINNLEIAVHCHDDFGMGTANALTALESGAHYADVSLLGCGERSGIAKTEEVLAYLLLQKGQEKYQITGIGELCTKLSSLMNIPLSRTKAVVGRDIFAAESGLHVHALQTMPELFEPYKPELVAGKRKIALGAKSGRGAVRKACEKYGISCGAVEVQGLTGLIHNLSERLKRPLTKTEVLGLYNDLVV